VPDPTAGGPAHDHPAGQSFARPPGWSEDPGVAQASEQLAPLVADPAGSPQSKPCCEQAPPQAQGQPIGSPPTQPGAAQPARLLLPSDWQACLALDGAALGGFWSEGQWRAELEGAGRLCLGIDRPDGEGPGLVAVACGWLVVDELHITVLAVHPASRRRGLGRQLLEALLVGAQARGALHATLEVAADNGPALALYAACHFQTAGTRRGYYRNGQDALIQWKRIPTAASGAPESGVR